MTEAGGAVRHYDDEAVFPLSPGDYAARPLAVLSAANETLWQEARARVLPLVRADRHRQL